MSNLRGFIQRRARRRQIGTWAVLVAAGLSFGVLAYAMVDALAARLG
jgi:hypothetical protein